MLLFIVQLDQDDHICFFASDRKDFNKQLRGTGCELKRFTIKLEIDLGNDEESLGQNLGRVLGMDCITDGVLVRDTLLSLVELFINDPEAKNFFEKGILAPKKPARKKSVPKKKQVLLNVVRIHLQANSFLLF